MSLNRSSHALIYVGGVIFGFGLAYSQMAQPEVVLSFLELHDFGLIFVMFGASLVAGVTFFGAKYVFDSAPLTGSAYTRRLKTMDSNVVLGGGIFGVGWGISGICPGAAYASLGVGNVVMLYGIAGMFVGAYVHGVVRSSRVDEPSPATADD